MNKIRMEELTEGREEGQTVNYNMRQKKCLEIKTVSH
jgi:hypothetical protein